VSPSVARSSARLHEGRAGILPRSLAFGEHRSYKI
jgi:hypothetical protein